MEHRIHPSTAAGDDACVSLQQRATVAFGAMRRSLAFCAVCVWFAVLSLSSSNIVGVLWICMSVSFTLSPAGGRPRGFFSVTTGVGDSASDILCGRRTRKRNLGNNSDFNVEY